MRLRIVLLLAVVLVACGGKGKGARQPGAAGSGSSTASNPDRPSEDDLAPIAIPVSTLQTTRFKTLLKEACENVEARKVPANKGSFVPDDPAMKDLASLRDMWNAANKAASSAREELKKPNAARAELEKVISAEAEVRKKLEEAAKPHLAKLQGIAHTCAAIRGETKFEDEDVAILRTFKAKPEVSGAFVSLVLLVTPAKLASESQESILSVGSLGSMLIEGLANFVYNRAKAEAIGFVATRLKNLLCGDHKDYFKHLCVAFEDLDATTSLSAIGTYLGTAARKDVLRLPDVAMTYEIHSRAKSDCKDCPKLVAGRIAYAYFMEVAGGRRALDVARSLHRVTFTDTQLTHAKSAIRVVGFASVVLDAIMQQENWSRTPAPELPFLAIAVAFTVDGVEKTEERTAGSTQVPTWEVTASFLNENKLRTLQLLIQNVLDAHKRMEEVIAAISRARNADEDAPPEELGPKDLAQLTSLSLTELLGGARDLLGDFEPDPAKKKVLREQSTIVVELVRKFARFGELALTDGSAAEIAVAFTDFADLLLAQSTNEHIANIRKALPIVTQLARAKSSDEVVEVLEAAALPIGGYKIKSEKSQVTLTAFAGIAGGVEYMHGYGVDGSVNAFAPVGLHLTKPWCGNVGLFISVLNLGNLISTRFSADTKPEVDGDVSTAVSDSQTLEPLQVFSPGLFVTKSFGESPFAFGAGLQVVPDAREVETSASLGDGTVATSTQERSVVQFLIFIGVDVSIFSF